MLQTDRRGGNSLYRKTASLNKVQIEQYKGPKSKTFFVCVEDFEEFKTRNLEDNDNELCKRL